MRAGWRQAARLLGPQMISMVALAACFTELLYSGGAATNNEVISVT